MALWVNSYEALREAAAFPWKTNERWQKPECERDVVSVHVPRFGPWALLLFRPHDPLLYHSLQDIAIPLSDPSIGQNGLEVEGFLCTDIQGIHGRHYWFAEPSHNGTTFIYDSLKGLQQLSPKLAKSLCIVGILYTAKDLDKPGFSNTKFDQVAGKLPLHRKRATPIKVAARSQRNAPRKTTCRANTSKKTAFQRKKGSGGNNNAKADKPEKSAAITKKSVREERSQEEDPSDPISDGSSEHRSRKHLRSFPGGEHCHANLDSNVTDQLCVEGLKALMVMVIAKLALLKVLVLGCAGEGPVQSTSRMAPLPSLLLSLGLLKETKKVLIRLALTTLRCIGPPPVVFEGTSPRW